MESQRKEIVFSMSHASYERVEQLLGRCGHTNLNLLLARGLALVEFVEDEKAQGRPVGSTDARGEGFVRLSERAELLKPGNPQRLHPARAEDPAQDVSAAGAVDTTNPKLIARPRTAPPIPIEQGREPRARRQFRRPEFAVNDDAGPVRSLAFHEERCAALGINPPIAYNGHALPGELDTHHLATLEEVMAQESMATHFQLCPATDELVFFGFFPRSGWHRLNQATDVWAPNDSVQTGGVSVFPLDMAANYLRRQRPAEPDQRLEA